MTKLALSADQWARRSLELIEVRGERQLLRSRRGWLVCDDAAETLKGPMTEAAARLVFLAGLSDKGEG